MTPIEIKVAMMRKGISQRELARRIGVHYNTIGLVIKKRLASPRVMEAVAEAIGEPESYVFPEHFGKKQPTSRHLTGQ